MWTPVTAQMTKEPAFTTRYSPSRYSTSARPSGRSSRSILFMRQVYPSGLLKQTILFVIGFLRPLFRLRWGRPFGNRGTYAVGKCQREGFAGEHGFGAPANSVAIAAHQHKSTLQHGGERDAFQDPDERRIALARLRKTAGQKTLAEPGTGLREVSGMFLKVAPQAGIE